MLNWLTEVVNTSRRHWFHMALCLWGFNIQRKLDHICLWISHVYFWMDLAMPSHARPSPVNLWLIYKKMIFIPLLILEILEFQGSSTIRLVESILGDKSRPRFLPDMEFGIGSQLLQQFSFQTALRNIKWKKFQKTHKIPCFFLFFVFFAGGGRPFCPITRKSEISAKIRLPFLSC